MSQESIFGYLAEGWCSFEFTFFLGLDFVGNQTVPKTTPKAGTTLKRWKAR
jgi:hypothetical protein